MDTATLVSFLKSQSVNARFIDRLKITYRPYICPFDELIQLVNKDDTVFDIGCGSGQFAMLLAEFSNPRKIQGIEISHELIKNARELTSKYPEIDLEFNYYDGNHLPESLNQADKVFMIDVLHHVPASAQVSFIEQLYTRMKPGGRFILKDIDAANSLAIFNKFHDLIFSREIGNELSFGSAQQLLRNAGFHVDSASKNTRYVYPHYTLIACK